MKYVHKNIAKGLVSALIVGTFVAITPVASNAAAPVGNQNQLGTIGTFNESLFIATENSGTAVVASATHVASTGWDAKSKGLVSKSAATSSSTGQTAVVALNGVLSLYNKISTTTAIEVTAGTLSSPLTGGNAGTLNAGATVALFTYVAASTSTAVLWTAPATAGTYTINLYAATSTAASVPTTSAPNNGGTATAYISVTVGGTHPLNSGTNSPDTLGAINGSMFTAVASNTGLSAVVHPAATLGTGEATALSKGLLYKDATFTTAQVATVLAGGVLSYFVFINLIRNSLGF
jgi:hypothetical protein